MAASRQKTIRSSAHTRLISILRERRIEASISQEELAGAIGWPQPHISVLESGDRRLDVIEFLRICQSLDVDPLPIIQEIYAELDK